MVRRTRLVWRRGPPSSDRSGASHDDFQSEMFRLGHDGRRSPAGICLRRRQWRWRRWRWHERRCGWRCGCGRHGQRRRRQRSAIGIGRRRHRCGSGGRWNAGLQPSSRQWSSRYGQSSIECHGGTPTRRQGAGNPAHNDHHGRHHWWPGRPDHGYRPSPQRSRRSITSRRLEPGRFLCRTVDAAEPDAGHGEYASAGRGRPAAPRPRAALRCGGS
jgi:hypothetical protein